MTRGRIAQVGSGWHASPLRKDALPSVYDFDPTKKYSRLELAQFADAFLWWDIDRGNDFHNYPMVLMVEHYQRRRKREVYVTNGTPNESILSEMLSPDGHMMYNRSHPLGRSLMSDERRAKGASFYRG